MIFFLSILSLSLQQNRFIKRRSTPLLLPKNAKPAISCQVCTNIISFLEQMKAQSTSESKLIESLNANCNSFPAPYNELCQTISQNDLKLINLWIESGIEYQSICTKLGVCNQKKFKSISSHRSPHLRIFKPNANNGQGCEMCTKVVSTMNQFLIDGTDDEEIRDKTEKICENFAVPYDSICDFYIEEFYKWILQQLRGGQSVQSICVASSMCQNNEIRRLANPTTQRNSNFHFVTQKRSHSKKISTVNVKSKISQDN